MEERILDAIIEAALEEDMPQGDVTSESVIPDDSRSQAIILAKENGILAGLDVARRVFEKIDPDVKFEKKKEDGQKFSSGQTLAVLQGTSISLLKGERTALNFLQRMSGIATATGKYVLALKGTQTRVLDTRKTTPGLRNLEKYAVKMGGGQNHRHNLSEMVLIKDNHLKLVGSISEAVRRAKERIIPGMKIEVETTCLKDVQEAVQSGADMVMLDNMPIGEMREVIQWVKGRIPLEVSGMVTLEKIREIADLGIDYISVGSLTHSYKSVDICMEFLGEV